MNSCNTPRMRTSNSWSNWFLEHWAMARWKSTSNAEYLRPSPSRQSFISRSELLQYAANAHQQFVEQLVLGTLGDGQMEIDVQCGILASVSVQTKLHILENLFQPLQVGGFQTFGRQGGEFRLQDEAGFTDILQLFLGS